MYWGNRIAEHAGGVSVLHSRTTDNFCAKGGNAEDKWEVFAMMVRERVKYKKRTREGERCRTKNKKTKITDEKRGELCMVSIGIALSHLFLVMV